RWRVTDDRAGGARRETKRRGLGESRPRAGAHAEREGGIRSIRGLRSRAVRRRALARFLSLARPERPGSPGNGLIRSRLRENSQRAASEGVERPPHGNGNSQFTVSPEAFYYRCPMKAALLARKHRSVAA